MGTLAFYGPTNERASKAVASVNNGEGNEEDGIIALEKWFTEDADARYSEEILAGVLSLFNHHEVKTVIMIDGVIGCPHEQGVDYEGPWCPRCPFWIGRDRFTGEMIQ